MNGSNSKLLEFFCLIFLLTIFCLPKPIAPQNKTPAGTSFSGKPVEEKRELKAYLEEVSRILRDSGYSLENKHQFNGAVFKGNSVIYKIHLPFIQEEGFQKYKLGIGLAHDDSSHSFLVQIYRSDKKDKKIAPIFSAYADPVFFYEFDYTSSGNHFLVEITLEDSTLSVAKFELLFSTLISYQSDKNRKDNKGQYNPNQNHPGFGPYPSIIPNETRNYFEVFKKEF
ncbi:MULTISPECIES: hypothetical protein [Leptospira]|uniref:Uncharacterized protein n=3 Tax=Leptospira weilii TaxID=28184 RepID=N1TV84_9LEPT|nr:MULTISPECIES: hypothetical protein [Leptospira]EMM72678.1 hypothetical protein LEP1GSC038_1867 [Leptospira weilii str. 2006001855]EMY12183.1 hypothetical protein LEP1GSC043_1484 [Leptospira weilii str. Ecochallenge]EMJ66181.1 hypothetical protein LEP1GSC051_1301 [Leptospira sp. P2653]EMN91639.1 hypothetical protein LEP1GSC108_4942 [Leptospira weilii str. UI 13098]MDL5246217.1 hypothetical protein [Leptospira weilii]